MLWRLLLVALAALSLSAGAARAEGANCPSLVERECPALARVTAKGDLRVEIFTRKRAVTFPLSAAGAEQGEELAASCPDGRCECGETVQHFEFKGPVPGFRQVNAAEQAVAAATKCSIDNSTVVREATRFAVSKRYVSTAVFELEYCHTCGGSCHGHTELATYDGKSGALLKLRAALKPGAEQALREHMAQYVVAAFAETTDPAQERARILQDLSQRPSPLDEGFYVEGDVVFVNLDSFALGCADGSFYPVPVPPELLAPAFAATL